MIFFSIAVCSGLLYLYHIFCVPFTVTKQCAYMHVYKYFISLFYKYFKHLKYIGPIISANENLSIQNRYSLGPGLLCSLHQKLFYGAFD